MPRILGAIALAGRLRLSALPKPRRLAGNARTDDLQRMPASGLGDSGHDLRGEPHPLTQVVAGVSPDMCVEERDKCAPVAPGVGSGIQERLVHGA